jgi:hypothetical protein
MMPEPLTLTDQEVLDLITALNDQILVEHARGLSRDHAVLCRLDTVRATLHRLRVALRAAGPQSAVVSLIVQPRAPGSPGASEDQPRDSRDRSLPPRRPLRVWFGDVEMIVLPSDPAYEEEYRLAVHFYRRGTPMPYADEDQAAGETRE